MTKKDKKFSFDPKLGIVSSGIKLCQQNPGAKEKKPICIHTVRELVKELQEMPQDIYIYWLSKEYYHCVMQVELRKQKSAADNPCVVLLGLDEARTK